MAESPAATADAKLEAPKPAAGKRRRWLLPVAAGAGLLLLVGAGAAAIKFVPGLSTRVAALMPGSAPAAPQAAGKPIFIDVPEMLVTLSNGGRPRQLRIRLSLELAKAEEGQKLGDVLGPRIYDALLTYLRTLREPELDGAIAIDRLRGDMFRRLDLVLGPGVLRDVLVTELVIG